MNESNMPKQYAPASIEQHWAEFWSKQQLSRPSGTGEPYCIMLPPPNVTGRLHMGHGFQISLMDALIRYQRMLGKNVLWQVGADHAGIATQMVVERKLLAEGKKRTDLGREAFLERVWQWQRESGGTIMEQIRRLGASVDWSRERFSLDPGLSKAVNHAFVDLYEEGLLYRGNRLVNWDPHLKTAISDLEVITKERQGHLWHIRYPFSTGEGHLIVATTRPETLLGDTAVAVHPDDERYQPLLGKKVKLPLTDREITIIADDSVDPEFGTGCVKITPAHDFNDYATGQRHQLAMINIFTQDAHLNNNVPKAYQGLERYAARKQIVADLEQQNLLEKIEDHTLQVPHGDRSDAIIEPLLTDQWFLKAKPLAEPAIAAVNSDELKFVPENWTKTYLQWLNNIQDWCVSRQLWWGHRIPAWYDEQENIYVGLDEADVRRKYKLTDNINLRQDNDVLDTWWSAALWPMATLGWPEKTAELNTFYPTNVLVTGFDIIFFWVARMVMMGVKFTGKLPFKEVYITGLIRDSKGQKMSKSKGNVLDPIDLIDGINAKDLTDKRIRGLMQPKMAERIEKATTKEFPDGIAAYGTDALRFTFCALATTGRDIKFDLGRIEGYRNFCNKLWNAARYVLMNIEGQDIDAKQPMRFSLADRWLQTRLQQCIEQAHQHFTNYRFDLLAQCLYDFIWGQYCDWYLELAKVNLNDAEQSPEQLRATRYTLISALETLLRLIHPLMPFISEEIWQRIAPLLQKSESSIMLTNYPAVDNQQCDMDAFNLMQWCQKIIIKIRTIRAEMNIAPSKKIPLLLQGSSSDQQHINTCQPYLMQLARLEKITWLQDGDTKPESASAMIDNLQLHIPLAGLIDKQAELARINKEIAKLEKEIAKQSAKLNNENYLKKAPAAVVAKQQASHDENKKRLDHLREQTERLQEF